MILTVDAVACICTLHTCCLTFAVILHAIRLLAVATFEISVWPFLQTMLRFLFECIWISIQYLSYLEISLLRVPSIQTVFTLAVFIAEGRSILKAFAVELYTSWFLASAAKAWGLSKIFMLTDLKTTNLHLSFWLQHSFFYAFSDWALSPKIKLTIDCFAILLFSINNILTKWSHSFGRCHLVLKHIMFIILILLF